MSTSSTNIVQAVRTKQELDQIQYELGLLLKSVYKGKEDLKNTIEHDVTELVRDFANNMLRKSADTKDIIKQIEQALHDCKSISVLHVTLAFEPTNAGVNSIYTHLSQNFTTKFVVEFHFDPRIIGGAIVEYNGRYEDYSLRKKLNSQLKILKTSIMSNIKL